MSLGNDDHVDDNVDDDDDNINNDNDNDGDVHLKRLSTGTGLTTMKVLARSH